MYGGVALSFNISFYPPLPKKHSFENIVILRITILYFYANLASFCNNTKQIKPAAYP